MKRFALIFAAVVVLAAMSISCNNYVCPAYSDVAPDQEQTDDNC